MLQPESSLAHGNLTAAYLIYFIPSYTGWPSINVFSISLESQFVGACRIVLPSTWWTAARVRLGYWRQWDDERFGDPPQRWIQELSVVRDRDGRPPRGPSGSALLLCVCGGSALQFAITINSNVVRSCTLGCAGQVRANVLFIVIVVFLQTKLWRPRASTTEPHRHSCVEHKSSPSIKPTAM